jgi:hypothetical protein
MAQAQGRSFLIFQNEFKREGTKGGGFLFC